MCLDVGRMSRYRICRLSDLKPHLEKAQIGYEKIGSRAVCVFTRASNSYLCQILAKNQMFFSASVNAAPIRGASFSLPRAFCVQRTSHTCTD